MNLRWVCACPMRLKYVRVYPAGLYTFDVLSVRNTAVFSVLWFELVKWERLVSPTGLPGVHPALPDGVAREGSPRSAKGMESKQLIRIAAVITSQL